VIITQAKFIRLQCVKIIKQTFETKHLNTGCSWHWKLKKCASPVPYCLLYSPYNMYLYPPWQIHSPPIRDNYPTHCADSALHMPHPSCWQSAAVCKMAVCCNSHWRHTPLSPPTRDLNEFNFANYGAWLNLCDLLCIQFCYQFIFNSWFLGFHF